MAITFFAAGSPSVGTTSLTPGTPSLVAPTDLLVIPVTSKYPPNAPGVPTDGIAAYTQGGQRVGGSGSAGADTGNVYSTIFYKVADGTEDSATVTISIPSGNSASAKVMQFKKAAGSAWDLKFVTGVNTTPGTAWSVTFGACDFKVGDLVLVHSGINTDAYEYSAEALAASGITFGAASELGENGITDGDDIGWNTQTFEVTAGDATAVPTFTMTASGSATNNPAGSAVLLRMRELGGGIGSKAGARSRGAPDRRVIRRSSRWSMVSEDRPAEFELP